MPRLKKQEAQEPATAKSRPVTRTDEVADSRKFSGQTRTAIPAAEGVAGFDVEPIQVVDGPQAMMEAEALAFAEDKLEILIHPSEDKNAENPVYVGVNGRGCYVWRGQRTLVPRKYVERLLRAQADNITQDTTAREEADFNRLTIQPTQRYGLSVLSDPSKYGAAWLQQITMQA